MNYYNIYRMGVAERPAVVEQLLQTCSFQEAWRYYVEHYIHDDSEGTIVMIVRLSDGDTEMKTVRCKKILE